MCITWPRICLSVHLLWCISYTIIGTIQIIAGVFFFTLPLFKLFSNLWIGILNIVFGIGGVVYASIGKWTLGKQRAFLYMAISVLIANIVNLVLLEVGEWHILLPENIKILIKQGNMKTVVLYARTITTLSTVVAALIAFVDSQITFCSMQYHERYHHKKASEKHDVLSDTEYVLPRVKSDSDENENASYFNKQYGQSWVYKTQTAETSTINSVPNRYSATSSDNLIDTKQTPSDAEFKDISTQNLNLEQPVVVVENTADYTDRQLHYMASFSRTPSPVPGSDSSSENSCSINGHQLQERLSKMADSSTFRSRLDSAKSTGAIVIERQSPCVSPRPPSISGGEHLRHDSLTADFHDTTSQRSFKISADQIFIPLKDETVIRIKDEVFITPNKPRRASPQPEQQPYVNSMSELHSTPSPRESKSVSFPTTVGLTTTEKVKSALPEVVDVIRKEIIQKRSYVKTEPSLKTEEIILCEKPAFVPMPQQLPIEPTQPLATQAMQINKVTATITNGTTPTEKMLTSEIMAPLSPLNKLTNIPLVSSKENQNLEEVMQQYLKSPSVPLIEQPTHTEERRELTPSPKEPNVPSPTLERQTKIERDDTLILDNEPYMFSQSLIDRQDTVIAANVKLPTPTSERQMFIERQDAIISPREEKSYILPPMHDEIVNSLLPSPIETEASIGGGSGDNEDEFRANSDDVDSNNSNNASTDKETIIDFKGISDDDEVEIPIVPGTKDEDNNGKYSTNICDMQGLAENGTHGHTFGNEIDNIFKIAEDPRFQDERNVDDWEDAELFDLNRPPSDEISVDDIPPPPDLDTTATFANIPPPEETDDINNGVDPDEWEESDDDSMNSSCVRRVPPPSTSND